jgi:signal transduction histidine kinase/CheY-like chemotaxis protein
MLKNLPIRTKLLLMLLVVALPALILVGVVAYQGGKSAIQRGTLDHLTSVRASKASQIETYFSLIRSQARTLSKNRMIVDAMRDFRAAHRELREVQVTPEQRSAVAAYYTDTFLRRFNSFAIEPLPLASLLPEQHADTYLQYHYIAANISGGDDQSLLDNADDGSAYSSVHQTLQPVLRGFLAEFGYHDLFLIDLDGHIVYTVSKEIDFATNVVRGPHRESNLAAAFNAVRDVEETDSVRLVDFARYVPSYGAPASFIATPIDNGKERLGVLVFQVPDGEIDRVMTGSGNWREEGLGESGESYLVGQDFRLRSNSRFFLEDPARFFSVLEARGVSDSEIERMRSFDTSILLQEVKTEAATAALAGETDTAVLHDYRGDEVLSSYAPLDLEDVKWAIVSEVDTVEAFAPLNAFTRTSLIVLFLTLLAVLLLSTLFSRAFVAPIVALSEGAARFAGGDQEVQVTVRSRDEMGGLAERFNKMVSAIRERSMELTEQKELLENTLESLTHPFYVIDADDYTIQIANSAAGRVRDSGQTTCHALTHGRDTPCDGVEDPCPLIEVKRTGKPFTVEHIHRDSQGSPRYVEVYGYPIFNNAGDLAQVIEYSLDITERKRMELQLEEARDAAESANRAKSAFLANMSHELRTPMNAIIGYSEMLAEDAEDEGYDEMVPDLKKINSAGKHLLALINDILDLSKIEAGRMDLYLERFDLHKTLDEAVATVTPLVAKNDNRLVAEFADDLGTVRADLTKLRQALFNLLSNAAKFTEKGTITLAACREQKEAGDRILLSVSDTGIGIAADKIDQVFEEFSQADDSTTRDYGGTGLGLPISRRFCRMMGGDITARSEPGKGSVFTIELPAVVDALEAAKASVRADTTEEIADVPAGVHPILVIDDDPDSRDLLSRTLESEGYTVVTASGGEEGLKLAREHLPSLITLDVMMPGMDGWAVLKQLKADSDLEHVPVLMITIVGEKDLGYTLGAIEHLTKPVEREKLRQLVKKYAGPAGAGHALVIDDDESVRSLFCRSLKEAGWTVAEAENGSIALERVSESKPDLILLDLMMPVMDGFEFVLHFRELEDCSSIPIIVITAKDLSDGDRKRLAGGVERIIQKGALTRQQLLDQVRSLVAQHQNLVEEEEAETEE